MFMIFNVYPVCFFLLIILFFPGTSLANFKAYVMEENSTKDKITQLKKEVENFAKDFPMPGFNKI